MSGAKAIALLMCCGGILLSCSPRSRLPIDEYLDHKYAGRSASAKGDYQEAEKQYKAALAKAEERSPYDDLVAAALHDLGTAYLMQKKYAEAEDAYKRELAVAEKMHGAESPELLSALCYITIVQLKQARFDEAEKYNERALSIGGKIPAGGDRTGAELAESLRGFVLKRQRL